MSCMNSKLRLSYYMYILFICILLEAKAKNTEVLKMDTKKEAVEHFHSVDIKVLKKTNFIKIKKVDNFIEPKKADTEILYSKKEIDRLIVHLNSSVRPSSGGLREFEVSFLDENKETVREIWIMKSGEWGIIRPGTSWTLGKNLHIHDIVQRLYSKQ